MNEGLKRQLIALSKIMVCVVFAWLYAQGGSDFGDKWLRRFLAPFILCGAMHFYTKDWKTWLTYPLITASLSIGYGSDYLWTKIAKRGLYGLANGIASSLYNILLNNWLLLATQTVLLIGLYIVMGVFNPLTNARTEELFLGFMVSFIPLMSTKEK